MSTTAVSHKLDLKSNSTYIVKLGSSITAPKPSSRFYDVRYNYHPRLKSKEQTTKTIKTGQAPDSCTAIVKDDKQEWTYQGEQAVSTDDFVLTLKDAGGQKTATLERLDASIVLNVVKTPTTSDSNELKRKYAQISAAPEDELVYDGDSDEPDPDNVYDFRHYLNEAPVKVDKPKSTVSTPVSLPSKTRAKPLPSKSLVKEAPKKRKSVGNAVQTKTKRVKETPKAMPPSEVPEVRLSRRATEKSEAVHSDADDGELILENDDDDVRATAPKRPSSMAMALSGQLGGGPISLHSAASSPASHVQSPAGAESPQAEATYEFDFGGDDSDEPHQADDEDGDVEDLELPSPVQERAGKQIPEAEADDDDDLEEQLARAMAQEEDEPAQNRVDVEEESEEE